MFAAGAESQSVTSLIEHKRRYDQYHYTYECRYVALLEQQVAEHGNVDQNRHLLNHEFVFERHLLNVVWANRSCNEYRYCRCKHVDSCTAYGLVCLHVYCGVCVCRGKKHTRNCRYEHRNDEQPLSRKERFCHALNEIYEYYRYERTEYHYTVEGDVDNAATLGEHSAQCDYQKRHREL